MKYENVDRQEEYQSDGDGPMKDQHDGDRNHGNADQQNNGAGEVYETQYDHEKIKMSFRKFRFEGMYFQSFMD